jgi:hypothetical protein
MKNFLAIDPSVRAIAYTVFNEKEILLTGKIYANLYSLVKQNVLSDLVKKHNINGGIFIETQYSIGTSKIPDSSFIENLDGGHGNIRIAEIIGAVYQFCANRNIPFFGIKPYKWQSQLISPERKIGNNYRNNPNFTRSFIKKMSIKHATEIFQKHILDSDMADSVCIADYAMRFLLRNIKTKQKKEAKIKHKIASRTVHLCLA